MKKLVISIILTIAHFTLLFFAGYYAYKLLGEIEKFSLILYYIVQSILFLWLSDRVAKALNYLLKKENKD